MFFSNRATPCIYFGARRCHAMTRRCRPRAGGDPYAAPRRWCLARCQVAEAFEAGEIVVVNEAMEEGIAIGMRGKAAMGDATFRLPADGFGDAPVEAFGETIGLGPVRSGEAVVDLALGAETIEGMSAGRSVVPLVLHVDSEAIGELTAIVGEDRMNAMWKVGEEAFEEAGGGAGIAPG